MNQTLIPKYLLISIYAVFIGSQITEAFLLIPYWQSLSVEEFYSYYAAFGPTIGRFYTVLTIIASLIPVAFAITYRMKKTEGGNYAIIAAIFALLVIASFYVYFKGVNESFYASAFDQGGLQQELIRWSYWHWGRILLEISSLAFLIMANGKSERA